MRSLRIRQVMQLTGLFRITINRLQLAGEFPKRRQLSESSVAWGETDISQWVNGWRMSWNRSGGSSALRGARRRVLRNSFMRFDRPRAQARLRRIPGDAAP